MAGTLEPGQVIILPFFPHQENKQQGEPRWALVVEILQDKVQIVPFTKNIEQQKSYSKTILVYRNSDEGRRMQINFDSILIGDRSILILRSIAERALRKGKCSEEFLDEVIELLA